MGKKSTMYYVLLGGAILGVLAVLGFGLMNVINAGWTKIAGAAQDKTNLASLETTITDTLTTNKGKVVTITATAA